MLKRFLWYAEWQGWPEDARLITEWNIRVSYSENSLDDLLDSKF